MSQSAFIVRSLGPESAQLLAAIHEEAFKGKEIWSDRAFEGLLTVPGTRALVIEVGAEPAGFILLRTVAGESEVLALAVRPSFRRRGIGEKLVRESMRYSPTFLEVSIDNDSAIALYNRCGFTEIGRRPAYYADGSDALVLLFRP